MYALNVGLSPIDVPYGLTEKFSQPGGNDGPDAEGGIPKTYNSALNRIP